MDANYATNQADLNAALTAPFHPHDIEWRVAQSGKASSGKIWVKAFAYVDNRAIMQRLDSTVGPLNWQTEIRQLNPITVYKSKGTQLEEGFITSIGIKAGEEWVWKSDGANNTDFEAVKGGLSGAMKRAAVSWGIGRYLYSLPEGWGIVHDHGVFDTPVNIDGKRQYIKWSPPVLPPFALPSSDLQMQTMMDFIKANYDAKKHGDKYVPFGTDVVTLKELMRRVKEVWGADYYLTLYIYEGLRGLV